MKFFKERDLRKVLLIFWLVCSYNTQKTDASNLYHNPTLYDTCSKFQQVFGMLKPFELAKFTEKLVLLGSFFGLLA